MLRYGVKLKSSNAVLSGGEFNSIDISVEDGTTPCTPSIKAAMAESSEPTL